MMMMMIKSVHWKAAKLCKLSQRNLLVWLNFYMHSFAAAADADA